MTLPRHQGRALVLLAALCAAGLTRVSAGDATWSTTPASGAWENGANWVGGTAPGATGTTTNPDTATFSGASTTLGVTPDATRNVKNIAITSSANRYAIGAPTGNALVLTTDGLLSNAATVTGTNMVNAPLQLQGDPGAYTFRNNAATTSTRLLLVGGPVSGVAGTGNATTLTLDGSNTGGNLITNTVSDGASGGALAIVKSGVGRWGFTGTNTYSGGFTLNSGSFYIGSTSAFGTGTLTINGGTILGPGVVMTLANNPMVWNGSFTNVVQFTKDLHMGNGAVTLNTNVTIVGTASNYTTLLTIGGPISDGANTYSLTYASPVANADGIRLMGNNTFKGGFTMNSGTVRIGHTNCLGVGSLTINGGTFSQSAGGPLTGVTNQTWNGSFGLSATAGQIDLGKAPVTVTAGTRTITLDNGSATFGGPIAGPGAALVFKGTGYAGHFYVNGTNTFDGGLTLLPGTANTLSLYMGTPFALGTGPLTINQGGAQAVQIDNTSGVTLTNAYDNAMAWNRSLFSFKGTRNLHLGTGAVTLGTNVTLSANASTLIIGGPIGEGDATPRSFTKIGIGTNVIAGAGTYSGGTIVTNGLLTVEAGGGLGVGPITVNPVGRIALKHGDAIANDAVVTFTRIGSSYGKMDLAAGIVERVGSVVLDGVTYDVPGTTFGAVGTGATVQDSNYFLGTGILKVTTPEQTVLIVR